MQPADGERAAVTGFSGQYGLAARIVRAKLPALEWIRLADPAAGIADDFQFKAGPTRHALQVKWSQYPGSFSWGDLVNGTGHDPALLTKLAQAWGRLRSTWSGPLVVHLRSNDYASSARPPNGTPLAESVAEGPRHFAAFLARSLEPVQKRIAHGMTQWSDLAKLPEVEQWSVAWDALRTATALDQDDFVAFVRDLSIYFAPPGDDPLLRHDLDPADSELAMLAWTLQAIVADPARPVQLSRQELLDRLGWSDRLSYRNPHRFPVPNVYAANEAARSDLEARLANLPSGYVALVGPAGSGKSTLLASLNLPGRVARYYAFVPDSPDPLSGRGEADSFLHDLSLTLETSGLYRTGYGNDLPSRRSVLLDQLDQAGQRWRDNGENTIIVVDGLDHISREQNPTRSLLEELPAPAALHDGVFVILGTQTTAILPAPIQAALRSQGRTVDLPPLSAEEVGQLADGAGPGGWLHPGQRDALVEASEGHPLALTYLLQELVALEQTELDPTARQLRADALLADASAYGRDVEERYRGYFRAVGSDRHVLDLLGAVARLRAPVDLDWLATWVDPHALNEFTKRTATFFHRNGPEWRFIHNSFRRFLSDETACVAGQVNRERDQRLHEALADVCAGSGEQWAVYRDEQLAHRFLAGQHNLVLELATPERLRAALLELRPLATVRDHALLALRAAAGTDDRAAYVRILLFLNELWRRQQVLEPEKLAATVLVLQPPPTAMEHVVRGGQLRVSTAAALEHAANFAAEGHPDAARQVLRASGGLVGLIESQPRFTDRGLSDAVADWAEATWHLSGLDQVLAQLDHHLPRPGLAASPEDDPGPVASPIPTAIKEPAEVDWQREQRHRETRDRKATIVACRNSAHARCFDLLTHARDDDALDGLTAVIDAEASADWRARARVVRAMAAHEDAAQAEVLRFVRELVDIDAGLSPGAPGAADEQDDEDEEEVNAPMPARSVALNLRLNAAELLLKAGLADAPEIDQLVPPGTRATWSSGTSRDGLKPFHTTMALWRLRELRPDPASQPASAQPRPAREAGDERFQRALRVLARLEGQQLAAAAGRAEPPLVAAFADPVIRLLEVPQRQTHDWTGWYTVRDAAPDVFRRLVALAAEAGGFAGLSRLLGLFEDAWTSPVRAAFWSPGLQQAILVAALDADQETSSWVRKWLGRLDDEIDARTYDPDDRVTTWLAQARAWARTGDTGRGLLAAQAAVRASLGVGYSDDDRQLVEWLDWLSSAANAGRLPHDEFLATIRTYASRIAVASSEASNEAEAAAERLLELTWPADPALACALAESFCDAGVLEEALAIQAVTLAACRDHRVPVMFAAVTAANMLLPVLRVPSSEVADALRARDASEEAVALLLRAAEVWTVPDERTDTTESSTPAAVPPPATTDGPPAPATAGALLTALRNTEGSEGAPAGGWDEDVESVASGIVPGATARALLEQAARLRLGGAAIGHLASLAARSGEADVAAAALTEALARTRGYGWLKHADGGSRLKIFDAALRDRNPVLVGLAARDLAGSLTSGALSWSISPTDLKRISDLVTGADVVAEAWPDVASYLDEFAPEGRPMPDGEHEPAPTASPSASLMQWLAGYLGHPVRSLDFGARRTLQVALHLDPASAQEALAERVMAGGWAAEAAQLALVTTPAGERPAVLSAELTRAVQDAATSADAICRDLARRLARRYGVIVTPPAHRPLAAGYQLALPPLPDHTAPVLAMDGTPHLDPHDPRHMVAPFDEPLLWLAEHSRLEPSAVLHHAATIARGSNERWTQGGSQAQAGRLKARQQMHSYRPWAYMAGRRALGIVLAELVDAGVLGTPPPDPAYDLGFVDERLVRVDPQPVDLSTPTPWRRDGTSTYDLAGWCDETPEAAQIYAAASSVATPYVLAERSEWRGLEWGRPEEVRSIHAIHHGASPAGLVLPPRRAWEVTIGGAGRYPTRLNLDWGHEELVVHGRETHSDPRWFEWLALHPAVGLRLSWEPDPDELFGWRGADGSWRARTVRRARGQLSHQAPASAACAEVWQVLLSEAGRSELLTVFPATTRTLTLKRKLPANVRESRPEDEDATTQVVLSNPS